MKEKKQVQKTETKQMYVTKDMTIGDVVQKYPESAAVMLSYGLHCIGCHVNPFESIEMGAQGHGMPEEVIDKMIQDVNEVIKKQASTIKTESIDVNNATITVTEKAINKIKELIKSEKKDGYGLRIEVIPGGCSGFSFDFSFENKQRDNDKVMEFGDLKIYIDALSLGKINGSKVDFIDGLHGSGFKVDNPKAKSSCGCGDSFA